jgi:ribA/ribD-fused uncharacterized protein
MIPVHHLVAILVVGVVAVIKTDKHVFFWGSEFSNFYQLGFTWRGIYFNCAEQAMMWSKADTFGDEETKKEILIYSEPKMHKKLGRQVKNFDDTIWASVRFELALEFLYCKYNQNPSLKKLLIDTYPRKMVEASPYDKVWGIGLSEYDQLMHDESNWKGENLLGKALDLVREKIINEEGITL